MTPMLHNSPGMVTMRESSRSRIVSMSCCVALGLILATGCAPTVRKAPEIAIAANIGYAAAARPPIMRRLTEDQYRQAIADIFGSDIVVGGRFDPLSRTDGLLAIAATSATITPSGFEQYDDLARSIAEQVVDEKHRGYLIGCNPVDAHSADDACATQFLAGVGRELSRRPLDEKDLHDLVGIAHTTAVKLGNFYTGLSYALTALLEAPQFLFLTEATEPDPSVPGAVRLDGYSRAARLSFLLWNSTPDEQLLAAAAHGDLYTKKGLTRQVDRLLSSPRLEAGVRAFFGDMLGFDGFDSLQKDLLIYPAFNQRVADDAKEQTLRTIVDTLLARHGDYRDLFTTRRTFMSGPLGLVYQVPVGDPDGWVPFEFPPDDPRAGLVSQISFVALHSHPGRSSATLRGKAVRELLLCQKVPDPPGNVNFAIVQDTNNPQFKTARQRLTAHRSEPVCAGCHRIVDPIGLTLETFDGAGQMRTAENGAAIQTADDIDGKPVNGPAELGKALHDNPAATSCLVNRLYSYATGRAARDPEKPLLEQLQAAFAQDGYRLPELLRHIVLHEAFFAVPPPTTGQPLNSAAVNSIAQGDKS